MSEQPLLPPELAAVKHAAIRLQTFIADNADWLPQDAEDELHQIAQALYATLKLAAWTRPDNRKTSQ